jgi:hypothetical protein
MQYKSSVCGKIKFYNKNIQSITYETIEAIALSELIEAVLIRTLSY